MNVNRFRQMAPSLDPVLFEIRTEGPGDFDWAVFYTGRPVTGGSVSYCCEWLAKATA